MRSTSAPRAPLGDRRFLFARLDGTRPSAFLEGAVDDGRDLVDRDADTLTLAFANGRTIEGDARGHGEAVDIALYDRSVPARRVDPVFDEAVADVDDTLTLLRVDEPEYAGGAHRVSLVSRASVADVGSTRAATPPGSTRGSGCSWRSKASTPSTRTGGAAAGCGSARRSSAPAIGCPAASYDARPDAGRSDFPTLDVLARTRKVGSDLLLGVYADVERPGVVRVVDPVEPLP